MKLARSLVTWSVLAAVFVVPSTARAETPSVVVVDVAAGRLDGDRVRAAIARDLATTVVRPDDPRAAGVDARITIEPRPATKTLVVTYRKVTRTMPMPDDVQRAESSAAIVAANVARDEAADLLSSLTKSPPVARPSSKPSPPTSAQVAALGAMSDAVASYEKGAYEYRDAVASIVRLHYDAKKRAVLTQLDAELKTEKAALALARANAIVRLEAFIATHDGPRAHPEATPDAMYRLAALYDEADRTSEAIRLYERIGQDFPRYREMPGVLYYLAHALGAVERTDDAARVWRTLVERHPTDTKYVPEAWWQIGNGHFDAREWPKAEQAYARALAFTQSKIYGPALYKYAWTLYQEQRWDAATKAFIDVLRWSERRPDGIEFRHEATLYAAAALVETGTKHALEQVKDPLVVPQDAPWTVDVYRALGAELVALDALDEGIAIYETTLDRWPMHAAAPDTQNAIADAYEQKKIREKPGAPKHDALAKQALEARTKLARYAGATAWVDANKDDPTALRNAERLVRGGLRGAAVAHTNEARAAMALGDRARAALAYRLAETAWTGWIAQAEGPDAYEGRYWLADARRQMVLLRGPLATTDEIGRAVAAATDVRDSHEDDRFLDNAAFFVVELRDVERDLAYGTGLARRDEVGFDSPEPATRAVVRAPIPAVVQRSLDVRDDYVRIVPPALDREGRAAAYRFHVAETYFLYGHWDVARERFAAIWRAECGTSPSGALAWEKLVTMASKARDEKTALALVDAVDPRKGGRSCDAEIERRHVGPIEREILLEQARAKLGEKKDWAGTASLYERALETAPPREQAFEATMNAAYARKQVGEHAKAIALYDRFLATHGPHAEIYEALASTHVALFDYERAAETNARASESAALEETKRREAAMRALVLFASVGNREKMLEEHRLLERLHPSTSEAAAAAHRVASFEGEEALARFVEANRTNPSARGLVVEAASDVARARRARGADARPWLARTVTAFDALGRTNATPAHAYRAAEAAYLLLDADITAKLDAIHQRGSSASASTTSDVFHQYALDATEAKRLDAKLRSEVAEKFGVSEWSAVAIARQGAIWDALRTSLYVVTKPRMLDARGEALTAALRKSGQGDRADELEDAAKEVWRKKKERELDDADALMIARYATAVAYGERHVIASPVIARAAARLAHYTVLLGEAKMRALVTAAGLSYSDGMYVTKQRGLVSP